MPEYTPEQDAILRVMVSFTDYSKIGEDQFIDGLTSAQYEALRNLNVLRIDSGDDRIPEDYRLTPTGVQDRRGNA